MAKNNFERMMQVIDEVFETRNDPSQLNVNQHVIEHLQKLHPATLSEHSDENGPAVWILVIPTTLELMNNFLENKINEQQLFDLTPINAKYDALYLCSATALPEYRGKGLAKQLTCTAIENILKDHPLRALFVWAFTKEGERLAETIARRTNLPLLKKN